MDFGLLWYDDSPNRSLADKVARAAARYELKFGRPPTVCFVNPGALDGHSPNGKGRALEVGAIVVETLPYVQPHHFLVGVAEVSHGRKPGSRRT